MSFNNKRDEVSANNYSNVSFVPHQIEGNFNLGNKDLIDELKKRLSKLNIKNFNTLKQIASDEINSDSEIDINTLTQPFTNDQDNNQLTNNFFKLNKINHYERNPFGRYKKPTFRNYWNNPYLPDVQIEEKTFQYDRSAYDETSVYEWNIDDRSEHQIINIVQEMTMTASAY